MGIIYILLCVAGFSVLALFAKKASLEGIPSIDINMGIFLAGLAYSLVFLVLAGEYSVSPGLALLSVLSGAVSVLASFLFVKALRVGHYGFSLAILSASFVVPSAFAFFAWKESASLPAFAAITAAIFMMTWSEDSKKKEGNKLKWIVLILGAFFFNGVSTVTQAVSVRLEIQNRYFFLFGTYLSGALILLFPVLKEKTIGKKAFLYGAAGAAGGFAGIFFTLKAIELMPSSIVFPSYFGGYIMAGMLASKFIFKEKIAPVGYAGMALCIAGIALLSAS